eukprot:TRINITY_DN11104_c0_g1_i2.p1 TRINITY_DN11104_c0_g1~~TRINITY_DN11104_c0_g1_i2.p1  ORF type:complete len:256 (-),score=45.18 TRINITY_DN11104_c0_g1_i2:31-798(-)
MCIRDRYVMVAVEDTGVGMSEFQLEYLKDVLKVAGANKTVLGLRSSKGACLGLSMTQSIAVAIGSPGLFVKSREDIGSTFSLLLPFVHQDEVIEPKYEEFQTTLWFNSPRFVQDCVCRRILAVDDNNFNLLMLKTKLRKFDLDVEVALSGEEALTTVANLQSSGSKCVSEKCPRIRLIFMDVDMPIMNGLETTKLLVEKMQAGILVPIPIIGCSAFDSSEDVAQGLNAGMVDYISKPVKDEKLTKILKTFRVIPT